MPSELTRKITGTKRGSNRYSIASATIGRYDVFRKTVLTGTAVVLAALTGGNPSLGQSAPTGDKGDFMLQVDGYRTEKGGHMVPPASAA